MNRVKINAPHTRTATGLKRYTLSFIKPQPYVAIAIYHRNITRNGLTMTQKTSTTVTVHSTHQCHPNWRRVVFVSTNIYDLLYLSNIKPVIVIVTANLKSRSGVTLFRTEDAATVRSIMYKWKLCHFQSRGDGRYTVGKHHDIAGAPT